MSSAAIDQTYVQTPGKRGQVISWALWDWGSAAYNAVILTFVFSVYLTDSVGADLPGSVSANSWLAWSIGIAGFFIAVLAPVTGQRADAGGHRKLSLGVWTGLVIAATAGLFFVKDEYTYLWLGLVLLALGSIFFEFASVSYNAMLRQVSTPDNIGRISGFGWAMGYFGGIILLLLVYVGFVVGEGDTRGALGISTDGGLNIRLIALVAALWFALFAVPVLLKVPETPGLPKDKRLGFFASYKKLFADLKGLYRSDPHTVYFLGASALFRDGLAAIFTFGAVLAVTVYDINEADVLIFGVAANISSALGAIVGGRLDDRLGPKAVVMGSLIGMLISGGILAFLEGPTAFWIFGLLLTLFVGPAQSSSRTYLARLTPPGHEGQMFGLYATTGRAVSFLAPSLVGFFTFAFQSDRAGIIGILLVLAAGTLALWRVRPPSADLDTAHRESAGTRG
ncbi:MAG: MFS transporter [Actinomycetota bacterium]|nr:MFS transporter [Actinomycetota bacterium]